MWLPDRTGSQIEQIAPAVDDANDLDALIDDAIENHMVTDNEVSQPRPNVVAGRPMTRVVDEPGTCVSDAVEQSIGSCRVIRRNMLPDLDQVLPRPAGAKEPSLPAHPALC
jgi:hypothetical protein